MLARLFTGTTYRVVAQGGLRFCLDELRDGEIVAGRFQTRPDIMILQGDRPVLLIDTKWKRLSSRVDDPKQGVSQSDVYQMMAYGRIYGCPKLMLLYPHHHGLEKPGEAGRFRVTGCEDLLMTATLDMAQRSEAIRKELAALPAVRALLTEKRRAA
jgi:5-methylcytosine-specific restriction enzyme subunit McrC